MLYLDASALIKRYVKEKGREQLESRLRSAQEIYTSTITYAEVHAALARKYREGELTKVEFNRAGNDFEKDWLELQEVSVNAETLSPVRVLVGVVRLRGMDAIHLAAAVWLERKFGEKPDIATSDRRLFPAAQTFGFVVWDPAGAL